MSIVLDNLLSSEEDESRLNQKILRLILEYEAKVDKAEKLFELTGVKLEEACRVLPKNLMTYDRYYHDMKTLEEWLIVRREQVQSKLWKKFTEGYPRALAAKDIQMYIQGDPEFVEHTETILEVSDIKTKLQSIVKAFEQMGWMLGHMTKLRVAELQDAIL